MKTVVDEFEAFVDNNKVCNLSAKKYDLNFKQ